ncbi:MAG: DnaB-like helicase C-terminal domain-containing protein, partial [Bacteroidota bacterium]
QESLNLSRHLPGLAKEWNIPNIELSQLSREVLKRNEGNKIPQLSDLRESGAIEQDADMVMFLYRPEYYDINNNEFGESNKGETHVRIAKHRNGSLETIKLRALLHIQKFIEDDFDTPGNSFPQGSNFRPLNPDEGGSRVFIQKASKMNDSSFDEEITF